MIDKKRLKEIKDRVSRATPGPWEVAGEDGVVTAPDLRGGQWHIADVTPYITSREGKEVPDEAPANRDLIVHAPSDLADLAAEIELLQGMVEDCDRYAAGEQAGKLAALRWAMRVKKPWNKNYTSSTRTWHREEWNRATHEDVLPRKLFDLLRSGELVGTRYSMKGRKYADAALAMEDLDQALVALSRLPLPLEDL